MNTPNPKYKFVRSGLVPYFSDTVWGKNSLKVYRIKALRDIPMHGVKKGDLGGEVTSEFTLSQEGECWIGRGAKVFGGVTVTENAYIGDKASVFNEVYAKSIQIAGNVRIHGSARVYLSSSAGYLPDYSLIRGNVNIYDDAQVINLCLAEGNVDIYGQATLLGVKHITGVVDICGTASINQGVVITGDSRIVDNAVIEEEATVHNSILRKDARVKARTTVQDGILGEEPVYSGYSLNSISTLEDAEKYFEMNILPETSESSIYHNREIFKAVEKKIYESELLGFDETGVKLMTDFLQQISRKHGSNVYIPQRSLTANTGSGFKTKAIRASSQKALSSVDTEIDDALNLLAEIRNDLLAYESDIVKILQYPVMTDNTDPFTLDMVAALKLAGRLALNPSHKRFVASVFDLEKKFLAAESNARRIASTRLTTGEKKNTDRALDLIAIAADEASSEQEKKVAFKQVFKQLEGIIAVPDVAVDTFRVKIGLKELGAGL